MLIIPFDRPIDWSRPPLATLLLLVVNVAVFFGFQLDDNVRLARAVEYYYSSSLHELELPRYRDYLLDQGETAFVEEWSEALDETDSPWLFRMMGDGPFLARLKDDRVITPAHSEYEQWRAQRAEFEARLNQSTVMAWGLKPASFEPATLLTHMFLHGGLMHLLGNMFFLVAVGFLVEMTLGVVAFASLYLLGGFGAAGLFMALNLDTAMPMVGASGAIAGLMGMYAVIYGLRRINFFYWVLVYFDYVKAPALILLPLWLGNELFQYFRAGEASSVAYMAHVGGLVTGAALAFGYKHLGPGVDEAYLEEKERREQYESDIEQVEEALRALEPDRIRPVLNRLLTTHPDDTRVLAAVYKAARFRPDDEAYHEAAQRILRQRRTDEAFSELWLWVYADYTERARPKPRFARDVVLAAAGQLLDLGKPDQARRFVTIMARNPRVFPQAPEYLLRLGNVFQRNDEIAAAVDSYRRLVAGFPQADERELAEQQLARLSR